jgi:hypothetical protein
MANGFDFTGLVLTTLLAALTSMIGILWHTKPTRNEVSKMIHDADVPESVDEKIRQEREDDIARDAIHLSAVRQEFTSALALLAQEIGQVRSTQVRFEITQDKISDKLDALRQRQTRDD